MPALADPQVENFCQFVASGESLTQAAISAEIAESKAPNWGSRKAKLPDVASRILELKVAKQQEEHIQNNVQPFRAFINEPFVCAELVKIERLAKKKGQFSVAHSCIRTLAELGGLLSKNQGKNIADRPESTTPELRQTMQQLPANERARLLAAAPELLEMLPDVDAVEVIEGQE